MKSTPKSSAAAMPEKRPNKRKKGVPSETGSVSVKTDETRGQSRVFAISEVGGYCRNTIFTRLRTDETSEKCPFTVFHYTTPSCGYLRRFHIFRRLSTDKTTSRQNSVFETSEIMDQPSAGNGGSPQSICCHQTRCEIEAEIGMTKSPGADLALDLLTAKIGTPPF